ncbi:DHS-like NAD/FAD-binding domain-containing protein [Ascodesmis nigricans]|uniref:DHS-like NAD/FAD-binding domain-containing protein n=1 Tax=Ascodesmis nigricans TaxID=341454 RepID=A0A4S2MTW0_9PEZI|nr:DHS-like NAD/FAD-binding domain-containing protein [Ascodesmis nigricans]
MVTPRIPYTTPFPAPRIIPPHCTTLPSAISTLRTFLLTHPRTLLLTGAGISVASGLSDYRGENGTYRLNRLYRPIFFHEFTSQHAARQRYWARSFLGWPVMEGARPNVAHVAVARLAGMGGVVRGVVTQNVDSLHLKTPPPHPPLIELHGTLRHLICLSCRRFTPRGDFQHTLSLLNPAWAEELSTLLSSSVALNPDSEHQTRFKTNPDGDYDLPVAPFTTFRYPPCQHCLASSPGLVRVDNDGAHLPSPAGTQTTGILKPAVTFFGESVDAGAKERAEEWVRDCGAVMVLGSSLATYSAWRLVRDAERMGKGVAVVNLGGVRGEEGFFGGGEEGGRKVRVEYGVGEVLVGVLGELGGEVGDLVGMIESGRGVGEVGGVGG